MTSLSSIEIDFLQAGRLCADFLAELLANPKLPAENRPFGPGQIVRRQSTRNLTRAADVFLKKLFKRTAGMTMRDWRKTMR